MAKKKKNKPVTEAVPKVQASEAVKETVQDTAQETVQDTVQETAKETVQEAPAVTPAPKKRRTRLHEQTAENDIKYRGPISYQGLQVLGWLCIVFSAVVLVMKLGIKADPSMAKDFEGPINILGFLTDLSLPCLLIANFSKILANREGYKKQLLRNGGAALAIAAVSSLVFMRYGAGMIGQMVTNPDQVIPTLTTVFRQIDQKGFIAYNLFIDLFLCTLTMYFLNARPKKVFTGKKVLILRFCTILPIAYELFALWLKIESVLGRITLPFWSFPLMPVKPPMSFVLFVFLAIHMKGREHRYRRHGKTHQEYLDFLKTNRNSLHFSLYLIAAIIAAAILDFILLMVLTSYQAGSIEALEDETIIMKGAMASLQIGIGETINMLLIVPLLFLYSYNREPKRKIISLLAPAVAIVLIIFVFLEGAYQGVGALMADKKVDLNELLEYIRQLVFVASAGI